MSYEPRGKVKLMVDAMQAEGAPRVWTSGECASLMDVFTSSLPGYLDAAIKNGLMHRHVVNGRAFYSLQPFDKADMLPGLNIPKFQEENWKPPVMTPPRGATGDVPRAPLPAPLQATPSPGPRTQDPEPTSPAPAPTSTPAPTAAPAVEPEHDVEEEVAEFAARRWADGDIDLFGLVELDDGAMRLQAANVPKLLELLGAVRC